jgi:hypothetical protein
LRTRLSLRPGENGSRKLQAKHSEQLRAMRHRHDATGQRRRKTVELVEEELPWNAAAIHPWRALNTEMLIRVADQKADPRHSIRAAGAVWRKVWNRRTPLHLIVGAPGLEDPTVER